MGKFEVVGRHGADEAVVGRARKPMLAPTKVTSLATMVSSVAAGYDNGDIIIWDSKKGSTIPLHQFHAHDVAVASLSFYGKLDILASVVTGESVEEAASHSKISFWSSSTMELRQTYSMNGAITRCLQMLDIPLESSSDTKERKKGASAELETLPDFVVAADSRRKEQLKLFKFVDKKD